MTYIAKRPLKIGDKTRQIGEEVPEAADWPRVEAMIRNNFIEEVKTEPTTKKSAAKKTVVQRRQ